MLKLNEKIIITAEFKVAINRTTRDRIVKATPRFTEKKLKIGSPFFLL